MQETCDACAEPWEVRFAWDYTSPEHYCRAHLLEPLDGQHGKALLDYMPDSQQITYRLNARHGHLRSRLNARHGHLRSTRELQVLMTGQTTVDDQ